MAGAAAVDATGCFPLRRESLGLQSDRSLFPSQFRGFPWPGFADAIFSTPVTSNNNGLKIFAVIVEFSIDPWCCLREIFMQ